MNANLNIIEALGQIAREKNVDRDMVIETLADALVSAARKRYGNGDNFEAQIDPETGVRMAGSDPRGDGHAVAL